MLSSAYHPQTDGQTEVVNRCIESYLRCMCGERPKDWLMWLPLAEWWYNTTYHSATHLTPYEAVYNQPPPLHLPYLPGESSVEAVDRTMQRREAMIMTLKQQLAKAQQRMKVQADKGRSERVFQIGDWVWLKLQPYRQSSVQQRGNEKLSPKYYGPFQVKDTVGKVAYKLDLPENVKIHKVFHVSQIKKFRGILPNAIHIPEWMRGLSTDQDLQPAAILERRIVKRQNQAAVQYLVHWLGFPIHDATWEYADNFEEQYPGFSLDEA